MVWRIIEISPASAPAWLTDDLPREVILMSEALTTESPPLKMTYEEFLEWADEDTRAEWVDGEAMIMSPASTAHQNCSDFLTALIRHYAEATVAGRAFSAPLQMKTDLSGREPDVMCITQDHLDRLHDIYIDGPADIAIEVISPKSRVRDRGEKYYEYEQVGGCEYWLIDPVRKQAEFYFLENDGIYRPIPAGDSIFRSKILDGFWLKLEWLWQEHSPPLLSVLKEWGLI